MGVAGRPGFAQGKGPLGQIFYTAPPLASCPIPGLCDQNSHSAVCLGQASTSLITDRRKQPQALLFHLLLLHVSRLALPFLMPCGPCLHILLHGPSCQECQRPPPFLRFIIIIPLFIIPSASSFPNGQSWGMAQSQEPGALSRSPMWFRSPRTQAILCFFSKYIHRELDPAPTWDTGTAGGGLAFYTTEQAPPSFQALPPPGSLCSD